MKPFNVALLLVLLAPAVIVAQGNASRIVGGQFAKEKQFPFYVALFWDDSFVCGGSIIDTRWILTAAHCVFTREGLSAAPEELNILAGTTRLHKGGQYLEVEKVLPHKLFTCNRYQFDIALIKLKEAIVYDDTMQKIELNRRAIPVGKQVIVLGHGRTGDDKPSSERLKFSTMMTVWNEICNRSAESVWSGILCLNNRANNGVCFGDSGGPAVYGDIQAGVASFGADDSCNTAAPDAFTDVAFYFNWIVETMKN